MDIAHDRAGYYLCWGCLNWVPAVYTSPTLFLVSHPQPLSLPAAFAIALAGVACIYINYDADRQRQVPPPAPSPDKHLLSLPPHKAIARSNARHTCYPLPPPFSPHS